ncbi:MAG: Ku protein [Prosthecobacter sp.]|nr:Ku protein [Prosthecobacter sp.]
MRAIWKGAISFGLVSIPVSLYPATRREELHFRLLRTPDLSPVNYKRVAEADGKEVPWEKVVKGYEYEKGKFVVLKDADFKRVDIEATQTVDIINFVKLAEVDPLLFYKPYYMEVIKGGGKAYVLLREALKSTEKIAIAKVVIKTRQHLAAVKPQEDGLMLELMHFPDELVAADEFKAPAEKSVSKPEMTMALKLIESMTAPWNSEEYKDDYREALEDMIEDKLAHGDAKPAHTPKKKYPSNVIDLVAVLQESIQKAGGKDKAKSTARKTSAKKATAKTAARAKPKGRKKAA